MTVDKTIYSLQQHLALRAGPLALPSSAESSTIASVSSNNMQPIQRLAHEQANSYMHYRDRPGNTSGLTGANTGQSLFQQSDGSDITAQTATQFTSPTQYSFPGSATSYGSNSVAYAPTAYTLSEQISAGSQQATAAAASSYLYSNMSPNANASYPSGVAMGYNTGPVSSWREWAGHMAARAGNMPNHPEPQEYLNSATALMQLGGRNGQGAGATMPAATDLTGTSEGAPQQWPLMVFDGSQPGA